MKETKSRILDRVYLYLLGFNFATSRLKQLLTIYALYCRNSYGNGAKGGKKRRGINEQCEVAYSSLLSTWY